MKTLFGFAKSGEDGSAGTVSALALPTSAGDSLGFCMASAAAALAGLPGFSLLQDSGSPSCGVISEKAGSTAATATAATTECEREVKGLIMTHADALLNCWCCRHLPQVYYDLREQQQQQQQQQQGHHDVQCDSSPRTGISDAAPAASGDESSSDRLLLLLVDAGYAETTVQIAELREMREDETTAAASHVNADGSDPTPQGKKQQQQPAKSPSPKIHVRRLALETEDLGTVDMVNVVAQHMQGIIQKQHPAEPTIVPHSKRALRLFATCQRAVRDLSGLQDTSLSIEAFLQDDQDFSCLLSRQQFEELCSPLKKRLDALMQRVLQQSSQDGKCIIAGVDVVGGGSRVPWVQEALAAAITSSSSSKQEQLSETNNSTVPQLRRTLDGSSSVAMGAALAAAGMNTYIRPLLDENRCLLQQQQIPANQLQAARVLGEEMSTVETAELRRCNMRNTLESYLLQMQSAMSAGPHRDLLLAADVAPAAAGGGAGAAPQEQQLNGTVGKGWLQQLLQTQEHWLLDHADAEEDEYRRRYEAIETEIRARCPAYFAAIDHAKQQKEVEIAAAAAETRAINNGGDSTATGASSLDRDMSIKLPNSQCIKRAKKNKDEGNEFFKGGNTEVAVQRYVLALQYVAKLFDMSPQDKAEADSIKLACNLNLAQAYLRLATAPAAEAAAASSWLNRAVNACDAALQVDPKSLKALYRRALSRERLRDLELAQKDVQEALALAPSDEDFLKLKERLEKQLRLQKEKAKKMYAKMFA